MDFTDRDQFCKQTANYVGSVIVFLAEHIGESAATERVLDHLAIVLEGVFDETLPEDMAWSLIPTPHDIPMPTRTT